MAGWFYITSDIDPYPTTHISHTYPEPGHHLHHIPIPYMAHKAYSKFHDKDEDVHQPKTDVRETVTNFYIEVELPGIKEHTELRLRWTSDRTLLLTSKTHRPDIPEEELVEEPGPPPVVAAPVPASAETMAENGAPPASQEAPAAEAEAAPTATAAAAPAAPAPAAAPAEEHAPKKHEPHLTVHERQVGEMIRAYNFPVDVDRDNTHAKLDAGLLRIVVPKVMEHGEARHIHVPIKIAPIPCNS
ncbi:uncharacterized protein Z519_03900 [Cladophialophora bantiana CBS 173.52]|uniref:SHSP domain-containing protein n=1 Tax=Cladophialophora bantiana (strain ATCC 10958 / CBS 173.52 / CDC B-1940 / NIH 8579) TaxID=1442370 RepID=A0A0D2EZC3_CLAB1|nr:uncharacterized protein Z519_03900 [Cladophialophora bantiana CBS 173.52]KIW95316.1 hypothetical protein Z519_03900 [Cladophialophora bantiana CBS 173.52]